MEFSSTEIAEEHAESKQEESLKTTETVDPDYVPDFAEKTSAQTSLNVQQQGAKEHTVKKIKNIVRNQFALEMRLKEQEIETIDSTIRQTRVALDRIRACVLARYYGMSGAYSENDFGSTWKKPRRTRKDGMSYLQSRHSLSKNVKYTRGASLLNSGSFKSLSRKGHQLSCQSEDIKKSGESGSLSNSSPLKLASNTTAERHNSSLVDATHSPLSCSSFTHVKSNNVPSIKLGSTNCNGEVKRDTDAVPNIQSRSSLKGNPGVAVSSNCSDTISTGGNINQSDKDTCISTEINARKSQSTVLDNQSSASGLQENHLNASSDLTGAKVKVNGPQQAALTFPHANATERVTQARGNESGALTLNSRVLTGNSNALQTDTFGSGSRFYVKKRVIIGNTSKYIAHDKREDNDKSTHKWMVYVRGPPEDPNIDAYIQKVWFFLHPSYRPNDIVEIYRPPFHLTRRGWGEFPIRVQLHFVGSWNKRVDIIHELKLDKTYTGLQTLGAETVVDLEIDRKTFEDLGIPVSLETTQEKLFIESSGQVNTMLSNNLIHPEDKLKRDYPFKDLSDKTQIMEIPNSLQLKKLKSETSACSSVSTPSISRLGSRCGSPLSISKDFLAEDGLEEQLHVLAERIPLITSRKDVINLPFRAESASQFCGWNVGKRRGAEWQRALKIRNQLRKSYSSSKITTKDVMLWCRRYGYTPQSDLATNTEVNYCKMCGRAVSEDTAAESSKLSLCFGKPCLEATTTSSTLSPALELLSQVETRGKLIEISNTKTEDEDGEIDIVGISRPNAPKHTPSSQRTILLTTPLTQEQQWIKDVCNEIGIGLRPEVMEGVEVHSTESALLAASMQFMKHLIRTAVALSSNPKSSLDPKLLVPRHIYEVINNLPQCDFLTNAYFGVDNEHRS